MIDLAYLKSKLDDAKKGKKRAKFIGYSKKNKKCEMCGKENLSRTSVFEMPNKSIKCFGAECAKKYKENNYEAKQEQTLGEVIRRILPRVLDLSKKDLSRDFTLKKAKVIFNLIGSGFCENSVVDISNIMDVIVYNFLTAKYSQIEKIDNGIITRGLTEDEFYNCMLSIYSGVQNQMSLVKQGANSPDFFKLIILYKWACLGFPTFKFYSNFLSQMAFTNLSSELINQVVPPFSDFIIEVPENYLFAKSGINGTDTYVRRIMVSFDGSKWSYVATCEEGTQFYRINASPDELIMFGSSVIHDETEINLDIDSEDERLMNVIGKIIINSCFIMNDKSTIEKSGPGHAWWDKNKESAKNRGLREVPKLREYLVGKDFKKSFKDELKSYIKTGKSSKMSLQNIVCGHSQRYHLKTGATEWRWKAPYWRGDPEADVRVRRIVLGSKE